MQISESHVVFHDIRTSGEPDIMARDDRIVVINLLPGVAVRIPVVIGIRGSADGFQVTFGIGIRQQCVRIRVLHGFVHHPGVIVRIQQLRNDGWILESGISVVSECRTGFRSAFRRYQNDTVGTRHAIGGDGSRIFQDGDRFDDVGVEHTQIAALHAVHDNQRSAVSEGRDTPDVNFGFVSPDFAGTLGRDETRHLADQRRADIGDRFGVDFVILDHPDGGRQRGFFLGTVTDHDLLDCIRVAVHRHVDPRAVSDWNLLSLHSHEREDQYGIA